MKVRPLGHKVLIKEGTGPQFYEGTTILIPESQRKKTYIATVVAVGEEVVHVKPNQIVRYSDHCVPTEMKHNGETHLLINVNDIFAILEDE